MHTTNYTNTFIQIADDCKAETAKVPPEKVKKSVARMQFEMLSEHPYQYTSDELLFAIYAARNKIEAAEIEHSRTKFFAKGQPCLRASPLGKTYGWGIHFDDQSRIALYPMGSDEYARLENEPGVQHLKAMRSAR